MQIVLLAVATLCFAATMATLQQQEGGKLALSKTNLSDGSWLNADDGQIDFEDEKEAAMAERVLEKDALETK